MREMKAREAQMAQTAQARKQRGKQEGVKDICAKDN